MSARIFSPWFPAALLALAVGATGCEPATPPPPAPVEVVVSPPVERAVIDHLDFTGRTQARDAVELRARIGGYLQKINFKDGAEVREGQVLFEIDDRTYRAQRDLAQAEVKLVDAQVKQAESEYRRVYRLSRTRAASQEELEKTQDALAKAQASLEGERANLEQAQLNLDYTQVKAPFSGRADRADLTVGNLVSADTSKASVLTSIVTLDPMYVYFGVDEPTLLRLRQRVRAGTLKSAAEKPPEVLLGVGEGRDYPFRGTLDFISNRVDPATGTLTVRGSFPNKDRLLRPGLFARVRVPVGDPRPVLLISDAAVGTNQGQKYVYVVDDHNEVVYRPVTLGALSDGLRVVEDGLKPGERVVVGEGMLRVRPGVTVVPSEGKMAPAPAGAGGKRETGPAAPAASKSS
jgi:RND family efflux transporter MFP subunit